VKLDRETVESVAQSIRRRELGDAEWAMLDALIAKLVTILTLLEGKDIDLERFAHTQPGYRKRSKPDPDPPSTDGADTPSSKPRRRGHGRKPSSDYLVSETVECSDPDLGSHDPCPRDCGGRMYPFRISSQIRLVGQAIVRAVCYRREVLRCSTCQQTFTAPLPEGIRDEKYDPTVDASLAVYRYGMGLPFHRIAAMLGAMSIPLAASVQFDRVAQLARTLLPVVRILRQLAARSGLIHTDDTTARVLSLMKENETRTKKQRTGIFATGIVAEGPHRITLYRTGRRHAGENLDRLLVKRAGGLSPPIHMSDALSRNESKRFRTIVANCLAHAVRKFRDVEDAFPAECRRVLTDLTAIYRIDDQTAGMTPDERLAHHRMHSGPIAAALKSWIGESESRGVEPNSVLGKSFAYVLNHWDALTRFLEVAGAPLDNNLTERSLKVVIRHRRNSLFYRTKRGALVGDILMSVIRTCQDNGVNSFDYLADVGRNAREVRADPETWLPWTWAERQASGHRQAGGEKQAA
jgi:transposase